MLIRLIGDRESLLAAPATYKVIHVCYHFIVSLITGALFSLHRTVYGLGLEFKANTVARRLLISPFNVSVVETK
jgi:hypothetical protein